MLVHNCFVTIAGQVDRWMLRGRDAGGQTGVKASRQATRRKTRNYLYWEKRCLNGTVNISAMWVRVAVWPAEKLKKKKQLQKLFKKKEINAMMVHVDRCFRFGDYGLAGWEGYTHWLGDFCLIWNVWTFAKNRNIFVIKVSLFSLPFSPVISDDTPKLSAFFSPTGSVYLEAHSSAEVEVDFLPFSVGERQCSVIFLNETIGEFLYSIEAKATLPLPSPLPYTPSSHSVRISSAAAAGMCFYLSRLICMAEALSLTLLQHSGTHIWKTIGVIRLLCLDQHSEPTFPQHSS